MSVRAHKSHNVAVCFSLGYFKESIQNCYDNTDIRTFPSSQNVLLDSAIWSRFWEKRSPLFQDTVKCKAGLGSMQTLAQTFFVVLFLFSTASQLFSYSVLFQTSQTKLGRKPTIG